MLSVRLSSELTSFSLGDTVVRNKDYFTEFLVRDVSLSIIMRPSGSGTGFSGHVRTRLSSKTNSVSDFIGKLVLKIDCRNAINGAWYWAQIFVCPTSRNCAVFWSVMEHICLVFEILENEVMWMLKSPFTAEQTNCIRISRKTHSLGVYLFLSDIHFFLSILWSYGPGYDRFRRSRREESKFHVSW